MIFSRTFYGFFLSIILGNVLFRVRSTRKPWKMKSWTFDVDVWKFTHADMTRTIHGHACPPNSGIPNINLKTSLYNRNVLLAQMSNIPCRLLQEQEMSHRLHSEVKILYNIRNWRRLGNFYWISKLFHLCIDRCHQLFRRFFQDTNKLNIVLVPFRNQISLRLRQGHDYNHHCHMSQCNL